MGLRNYYNEIDPFAAAWLRNLIKEKLIPDGDVDERSIADVQPVDLKDCPPVTVILFSSGMSA